MESTDNLKLRLRRSQTSQKLHRNLEIAQPVAIEEKIRWKSQMQFKRE
jgi:hypothetical protein